MLSVILRYLFKTKNILRSCGGPKEQDGECKTHRLNVRKNIVEILPLLLNREIILDNLFIFSKPQCPHL